MIKFLVGSAIPFQLFIVSFLTFYFGNENYINFYLVDVVPYFVLFYLVLMGLFLLMAFSLRRHPRLYKTFIGLVVGFALSVWVQSQILIWNFGPLDGREIAWDYQRISSL